MGGRTGLALLASGLLAASGCVHSTREPGPRDTFIASKEYVLVSAVENGMLRPPCVIYRLDSTKRTLSKVSELPAQNGIVQISAYPCLRKLVVWGYAPGKKGYLTVLDIDKPKEVRSVQLPFEPTLGGYFVASAKDDSSYVSWDVSDLKDLKKYAYSPKANKLRPTERVQWEAAEFTGRSVFRGAGEGLNVTLDPKTGDIRHYVGTLTFPLPFRLDEDSRKLFKDMKAAAAMIWANDKNTCVLGAQQGGKAPKYFLVFIFDKAKRRWTQFKVPGVHSHIQRLGDWLVVQEVSPNRKRPTGPSEVTGNFTFYNVRDGRSFSWKATGKTEVLGVWGQEILFRRADELYRGRLQDGKVSDESLLLKDQAVEDVHWVFRKRGTGNSPRVGNRSD